MIQTNPKKGLIEKNTPIETITLPISIGDWHYSRIRVIGNVVDSITEPRKKITITFYNDMKNLQIY